MVRRRLIWMFALGLAGAAPGFSQPAAAYVNLPLAAGLEEALVTGNAGALEALARPHREPLAGADNVALNTTLARAWLFLGDTGCALRFAQASIRASAVTNPVPRWLAAELQYTRRNFTAGDDLAAQLRLADPTSPVTPYLEGRRALARLADADADFTQPLMAVARRDAFIATAACTSADAAAHPQFDPRFLSLGIDVGLLNLDYDLAASYAASLAALRPRNAPLARLALALAFASADTRNALLDAVRTRSTLPAPEFTHWALYARMVDMAAPTDRATAWLALADYAATEPVLVGVYVHLIARAVAALPAGDDRLAAAVNAYADAAVRVRSTPHAHVTLDLLSAKSDDGATLRERRIALASIACRYDLAASLAFAEAPAHATDFDWLQRFRPIVARHQTPGVYLQYLRVMEGLRPDEPTVLIELARVYDQHTLPPALGYYDRAFTFAPDRLQPTIADWFACRNLVLAAVQRGQPGDAQKRFDATIERIHAAAPEDVAAAHFYADLLDRRARDSGKPADREAADRALKQAVELDPATGDLFGKLDAGRRVIHGVRITS